MYNLLAYNILYLSIRHSFSREFNQNYIFFLRALIPTHYECKRILVTTNLKTATLVAETCWRLLYNKITFIHSSAFIGLFNNITHPINARAVERIQLK